MKKGAVVGGQGGNAATATIPRGMLPPTGNGPIEVTRETVDDDAPNVAPAENVQPQQAESVTVRPTPQQAEPATAQQLLPPAVSDILTAALPESGEPGEVIVACEKRLYAANALLEAMQTKALSSYFHFAGPAVRLAWATESWRATIDPATGKECKSWSAWLRAMKVSRQHAYRMTKEDPIMVALKGLEVKKLGVRQIDVLSPVLTNFGQRGVRELWTAAVGWGDTGAASLLRLRKQLGLEPERQISEGDEKGASEAQDAPVLSFQTRPGVFDASRVREAARAQPDIALLVAKEIFAELGVEPGGGVVSRDTTPDA